MADKNSGKYDRVFILGIDGAGRFFEQANTPNFDRIFKNSAVKYNCKSESITVSAQDWGAILCGVSCEEHKFTNEILETTPRNSKSPNNSIFKYVRDKYPESELATFCNWEAINIGLVENDLNVRKYHKDTDEALAEDIVTYFEKGNKPKLMYVQFDSVDHAAHEYGGQTKEYFDAIENADKYIGEVYDVLDKKGLLEKGLFIVVADHGEELNKSHGGNSKDEYDVTLAVCAKGVNPNYRFEENTRNRDVCAIVLYALGIEKPSHITANLPENLFL